MTRAEKAAMEAYPPKFSSPKRGAKRVQSEKVDTHAPTRAIYRKGYEQAEKEIKDTLLEWAKEMKEQVSIGLNAYDMGEENGKAEMLNKLRENPIAMTQTELLDAIRTEIERQRDHSTKTFLSLDDGPNKDFYEGRACGLTRILSSLDTLQEPEVEGLEEEIARYLRDECSGDDEPSVSEIASHFAEWGAKYLKR